MAKEEFTVHVIGRILSQCQRVGLCLVWQGHTLPDGYGIIGHNGEKIRVHRLIYEHFNGPIPDGHEIDHVRARGCTSRACCEPTHLEAVTHAENMRRARQPRCHKGHELTGDNLSPYYLKRGIHVCAECKRTRNRDGKRRRAMAKLSVAS